MRNTCLVLLCCALRASIMCFSGEDARKQSYTLFNNASGVNSSVSRALFALLSRNIFSVISSPSQVRLETRPETFSWMYFCSAWFPTAGWSTGVQFQVALLFPERERPGALGAIPGQLRDQLNSRHSTHSHFEGKANREGFNAPHPSPLPPPQTS